MPAAPPSGSLLCFNSFLVQVIFCLLSLLRERASPFFSFPLLARLAVRGRHSQQDERGNGFPVHLVRLAGGEFELSWEAGRGTIYNGVSFSSRVSLSVKSWCLQRYVWDCCRHNAPTRGVRQDSKQPDSPQDRQGVAVRVSVVFERDRIGFPPSNGRLKSQILCVRACH